MSNSWQATVRQQVETAGTGELYLWLKTHCSRIEHNVLIPWDEDYQSMLVYDELEARGEDSSYYWANR